MGAALALAFALGPAGCGGSTSTPNAAAQTAATQRPAGGASQALFDKLLAAKLSPPRGYGAASASPQELTGDDKTSGLLGIVKITFAGSSDTLRLGVYGTADQASAAGMTFSQALPAGGSRKFLPYLPDAICAETSKGGACGIQQGVVFLYATAQSVDNGASALVQSGNQLVEDLQGAPAPAAAPASSSADSGSGADTCALLTSAEAASALHAPNVTVTRQALGICDIKAPSRAGDGITIQPDDGGPSKYAFDRNRISNVRDVSGVGDKAFVFASVAGFDELHILKGSRYVVVMVVSSGDRALLDTTVSVGKLIAGRM